VPAFFRTGLLVGQPGLRANGRAAGEQKHSAKKRQQRKATEFSVAPPPRLFDVPHGVRKIQEQTQIDKRGEYF
jgi:hypothetical protein